MKKVTAEPYRDIDFTNAKRGRALPRGQKITTISVISTVEVHLVTKYAIQLVLGDEELLLPFNQFPWFKKATIAELFDVEWSSPDRVRWPKLDVDLAVASMRDPASFPLISRSTA